MVDVLVTGIKIGDMPLKGTVSGDEKLPTGDAGDLAVTPNQIKNFTIQEGNLVNQEQLDGAIESVGQTTSGLAGRVRTLEDRTSNVDNTSDLDKPVSNATQAALDLKADKDEVVTSVNGLKGDVVLTQSDLINVGASFVSTSPQFTKIPEIVDVNNVAIPELNTQAKALGNSIDVYRSGLLPRYDSEFSEKIGGYPLNARLMLSNGDIVRSSIANNTNNPNTDMTGWVLVNAASQVVDSSGKTQQEINDVTVKNGDYAPVLGSPVKLKLNPIMASFIYGISDPTHKDDDLNNFRGINNPDAYHDSNVAIGAVSFGRNNPPFAYLSLAGGHDCVPFGVASFVLGAGSCTGNPDDPVGSANGVYGYCSLAVGKNTQARGRISNAMGERCLSESRYSSTDGYKCIAGKVLPSHPDYNIHGGEGEEGAAARAHGYESEAYGNFAFAYGSFLRAYNGAQVIGKGVRSSLRGLAMGYGVDRPTLFLEDGATRGETRFGWVGFNTNQPLSKYDWRLQQSDTLSYTIDAQGSPDTLVAFEVKGLLNDGTYGSLHNVLVTHPNSGQAYGQVQYRLNGVEYLTVDQTRKAKFSGVVEASGAGFMVEGKRVVGGQLPSISDSTGTTTDNQRAINEILQALRAHGLIAN